jgi:dienelactone hydrolase
MILDETLRHPTFHRALVACCLALGAAAGCTMPARDGGGDAGDSRANDTSSSPSDRESDGGADTDSESDVPDTDSEVDAGESPPAEDPDWRERDAGITWRDGSVEVDGPCAGDCAYSYELGAGSWFYGGEAYFTVADKGDRLEATGVEDAGFFFFRSPAGYWGHVSREDRLQRLELSTDDLSLLTAELFSTDEYVEVKRTRRQVLEYDAASGELHLTVASEGRQWGRVLPCPEPPIPLVGVRRYPFEVWGLGSPLSLYLIGRRYDWALGGVQEILVYAPAVERLERIRVTAVDSTQQRLVVYLPSDMLRPMLASIRADKAVTRSSSEVEVLFEHGIPIEIETLAGLPWVTVDRPPFELSLPAQQETTEVPAPPTPSAERSQSIQALVTDGDVDVRLDGVLNLPDGTGPFAAVVMLPGWSQMTRAGEVGAVRLYEQLAAGLVDRGYAVLRTDARGTSERHVSRESASVDQLAGDALAMLEALDDNPDVARERVFLLARGLGVHVVDEAALRASPPPAGVVFVSPLPGKYLERGREFYMHYLSNAEFTVDDVITEEDLGLMGDEISALLDAIVDGSYPGSTWRGRTPAADRKSVV